MNGKVVQMNETPQPVRGVQDEWGIFDPDQAGLRAAIRAVRALSTPPSRQSESVAVQQEPPAPLVETLREVSSPVEKRTTRAAVYQLEFATRCPQCEKEIGEVHVSRLLRTHASFTSTLPRKGYMILCPECDGILSAELSGLI